MSSPSTPGEPPPQPADPARPSEAFPAPQTRRAAPTWIPSEIVGATRVIAWGAGGLFAAYTLAVLLGLEGRKGLDDCVRYGVAVGTGYVFLRALDTVLAIVGQPPRR